jgi:Leucine-rich repeat (LRR) protein
MRNLLRRLCGKSQKTPPQAVGMNSKRGPGGGRPPREHAPVGLFPWKKPRRKRRGSSLNNQTLFVIVNTAFWLGLLALLLTDPFRLIVGGALLALAVGGYLLYVGLFPKITRGMAQPALVRWLAAILGLGITLFALVMLIKVFSDGVPTRQRVMQERLARASRWYTSLDLSDLGLRQVPPEVWDLEHLTWLDLSGNRLKSLPPEIGTLEKLERLFLWDNRLEALPPEIGRLSRLEWLDLDGNRLETLPPELAQLQQLTHLKLQYNRFKTFPNAILELPNLELLFLSGNRMGELPAVLTRRAEAGTLNLWYKPNASRFDWASASVIFFTFVLPTVLSWGVNRWWAARERAQKLAAQQEGTVFVIPPLFRSPALFVLFCLAAVSLFVFIAALNGSQTGMTMEAGVGIPLLFSPLMVGCLVLVLHNTGMVVLTAEGVALRRPGRERFLRYGDIVELKSQVRVSSSALLIRETGQTLRIPRTVDNLPRLYELLIERVPPAVKDAALGKTVAARDVGGPVYAFKIRGRVWALYIAGTVLFVMLYLGIGLMGLWIGLARGVVPPFTGRWLRDTAFTFLLVSTIFLPALIFIIRSFFTKYGPFEIKQPAALELYRGKIRYRFPRGPWQERPACDLQSMALTPLPFAVRARADSATGSRTIVEQEVTRHMLVLEFVDAERLVIDQERAAQFGESPERLHMMFKQLYGNNER